MSTVPYIFADNTGNIPLSQLDTNFANVKLSVDYVIQNTQANITGLGTLTALSVTGNIDLLGKLSTGDAEIFGNLTVNGDVIQIGNLVTDAKTIQLANTANTALSANGSGITVGANDSIATFLFNSFEDGWTTNTGLQINTNGNTWKFDTNLLISPSGGVWNSQPATLDEYITSAPDGYIDLQSLYANANVASAVHLEHGLVQIIAYNGSNVIWQFNNDGSFDSPGVIITDELVANNLVLSDTVSANQIVSANIVTNTISSDDSSSVVFSDAVSINGDLEVSGGLQVLGAPLRLPSFTSAEIANIAATNGDLVYNSTIDKFQGYENGAWANII
jgi:hypothetical protein